MTIHAKSDKILTTFLDEHGSVSWTDLY